MATTVHVKNISTQTTQDQVRDFFTFCGKIQSLSITPDGSTQSAAVTFEKPTAAKTAMLLDNTQLGPNLVQVTSATTLEEMTANKAGPDATGDATEVEQEDKPRSRIIAEYLAHGYTISDAAISRALDLDKQHGVSTRFTQTLKNFDAKYKVSDRAAEQDRKFGVSEKAATTWSGLNSYFEKALGTPSGQKIHAFYLDGQKQVLDVHNEARRLADLKSGRPTPESAHMHAVPGDSTRTQCNCGGATGQCPCEPGKCACSSCAKNKDEKNPAGGEKTAAAGSTAV